MSACVRAKDALTTTYKFVGPRSMYAGSGSACDVRSRAHTPFECGASVRPFIFRLLGRARACRADNLGQCSAVMRPHARWHMCVCVFCLVFSFDAPLLLRCCVFVGNLLRPDYSRARSRACREHIHYVACVRRGMRRACSLRRYAHTVECARTRVSIPSVRRACASNSPIKLH